MADVVHFMSWLICSGFYVRMNSDSDDLRMPLDSDIEVETPNGDINDDGIDDDQDSATSG